MDLRHRSRAVGASMEEDQKRQDESLEQEVKYDSRRLSAGRRKRLLRTSSRAMAYLAFGFFFHMLIDFTQRQGENVNPREEPVFWIADDDEEDFVARTYYPTSQLKALRDVRDEAERFLPRICGRYRFERARLPHASVIITVQNERPGLLLMTVQSIIARTPPELLLEIIVVVDNAEAGPEDRPIDPSELLDIKQSATRATRIKVLNNSVREGCARSRLKGAQRASGEVLVFVDSHIEMLHSTWLEHLLVPLLDNPRTMAVQTIEAIDDVNLTYGSNPAGHWFGVITDQLQFGYQLYAFPNVADLHAVDHIPWESPFGPGSLFAIYRTEFFRLGGYDKGLLIWGAENFELALKSWMCGGRVVFVPCSRVGHVYRTHLSQVAGWPPTVPYRLEQAIQSHEGDGRYHVDGVPTEIFSRLVARNDIRVLDIWLEDHPAKFEYYRRKFGSSNLSNEWQAFADQTRTDSAGIHQRALKRKNKCKDFEW
eukprot:CAMPEP_0184689048 /NCGR_PEP_ID=MMETSP0312-20130426/30433_1 /TAXON_ID=31354 /ORGANISM="Compsopogon coeruleus, Strain SAG 36.94" /LENGTH=482 /DNA_ID=CAMNT_0027146343 /DNA_START=94 /DNA_END=1539 /DNA_ORIENTATION=+